MHQRPGSFAIRNTLHHVFAEGIGKETEDVTKIHIKIEGPLNEPDIRTDEVKNIGKDIGDELMEPAKILEDFGEGLKKIF